LQPRKRGRASREDAYGWVVEEDHTEDENKRAQLEPRGGVVSTNRYSALVTATTTNTPRIPESSEEGLSFLALLYQWLSQEPISSDETSRAAVAIQSFIQGSLGNKRALDLALMICKDLQIDGPECIRWCRTRNQTDDDSTKVEDPFETFILDVKCMRLPSYIEAVARLEGTALFLYAYHNGHETYAANDSWGAEFMDPGGLYRSSRNGKSSTFLDSLANAVVEQSDRRDFLAVAADLIVRGKSSKEERSCIALCTSVHSAPNPHPPSLVMLRLWSDMGTQSFIFAMQVIRLPSSKYVRPSVDTKTPDNPKEQPSTALIENAQRAVERKKENNKWKEERELLTEEQLIAAMLPLDEVLELDELDIEAVAEYLHG